MLFGKEMNLPFDSQVIPKETMGKDANSILASFFENWRKNPAKQNVSQKREHTAATNNAKSNEPSFRMFQLTGAR